MAAVVSIASVHGASLHIAADFVGWDGFKNLQQERLRFLPPVRGHEVQWAGWVLTNATSASIKLPATSHHMGKQEVQLIGLAWLIPRGLKIDQEPLTTWDQEISVLRHLCLQPLDGCLVKMVGAVLFETPVPITRRRPSTRAGC